MTLAAADLAHGPYWWVGPLVLALVVYGPPLAYALFIAITRKDG